MFCPNKSQEEHLPTVFEGSNLGRMRVSQEKKSKFDKQGLIQGHPKVYRKKVTPAI